MRAIAITMLLIGVIGVIAYAVKGTECRQLGGVLVRSAFGHECVKPLVRP